MDAAERIKKLEDEISRLKGDIVRVPIETMSAEVRDSNPYRYNFGRLLELAWISLKLGFRNSLIS